MVLPGVFIKQCFIRKGKHIIGLCLLMVLAFGGYSQTLTWSEPVKGIDNNFNPEFVNAGDTSFLGIFSRKKGNRKVVLTTFDDQLKLKHKTKLAFDKDQAFQKAFRLEQKLVVIYSEDKADQKVLKLHGFSSSLDTAKWGKTLLKVKQKDFSAVYDKQKDNLLHILTAFKDKGDYVLKGVTIRETLQKDSNQTYRINEVENPELVSLQSLNEERAVLINNTENNNCYLAIGGPGKELFLKNLGQDSLITTQALLRLDRMNKQFLGNGFYRLKSKAQYQGITQFRAPVGKDTLFLNRVAFPKSFIQQVFGKNTSKTYLEDFKIRDLIPRSDGGTILLTEHFREEENFYDDYGYFGSNAPTVRHYYYFEEIAILAIGPKGRINWQKVHFKKQRTVNDEGFFSSFKAIVQKKRLILLYNKFLDNDVNLLYYQLKPDGALKGDILIKGKVNSVNTVPRKARQVTHNKVVIPAFDKEDRFRFLEVEFETNE